MIHDDERWEGLELLGYWALLLVILAVALAFACGVLWLAGQVWRTAWPVVWPWVQAHSDGLTLGLGISIVIGAVVALCVEGKR